MADIYDSMENTKICTKCNEIKNINNFSFRKERNSYNTQCKKCIAKKTFKFRKDNEEKIKIQAQIRTLIKINAELELRANICPKFKLILEEFDQNNKKAA